MTEQRVSLPQLECPRCGYTWVPRMEQPQYCPRCHAPRTQPEETEDED